MATQIQAWQIVEGALKEINTSLSDEGRTEQADLASHEPKAHRARLVCDRATGDYQVWPTRLVGN